MADYINKVEAMDIIASGKNDNAYFGTASKDWEVIDFLKTVPNADVIERKNVKNLIENAIEDGWELDYALERLKEI